MNNFREIERKFRIASDTTFDEAHIKIEATILWQNLTYRSIPICTTRDVYWVPPAESPAQFARCRDSQGTDGQGEYKILKELTVKMKDRGDNYDRLEVNVAVDSIAKAASLVNLLIGEGARGEIFKKEAIWFVPVEGGEAVLSLAEIEGELFFEVEAPTKEIVEQYCKLFNGLTPEPRSLFEIFVLGRPRLKEKVVYV